MQKKTEYIFSFSTTVADFPTFVFHAREKRGKYNEFPAKMREMDKNAQ